MVRVGYQGVEGSNSEEASKQILKKVGIVRYELVPLMNSESVISRLADGKIDLGVIAISNTLGGEVKESRKALERYGNNVKKVSDVDLKIHHCLYKKDTSVATGKYSKGSITHTSIETN